MYLSKVLIDKYYSRDIYKVHQALWSLFPDDPDKKRDFLYRVEKSGFRSDTLVIMQSNSMPIDMTEKARLIDPSKVIRYDKLVDNQCLRFLVRANPVKTIKDNNGRKDKQGNAKSIRVPLLKEEELVSWLYRKLSSSVEVKELRVNPEKPLYFNKAISGNLSCRGKLVPVLFEGILTVANKGSFLDLLSSGIGPAKGMGLGMLSVASM